MTTSFSPTSRIFDCLVVGAGIAGICAALEIQLSGGKVAILEPSGAGSGASFGNAGIVVNTKLMPVFAGMTPLTLLSMLRSPASPLNVRWSRLPQLAPWFLKMLSHSGSVEVERITRALASLSQPGGGLYAELWKQAGLEELVNARGSIALNRSEAERDEDWEGKISLLRQLDVPMQKVGRAEIAELAPSVSERYSHGIYSPDFQHSLDPHALVSRLADLFIQRGGVMLARSASALFRHGNHIAGVQTTEGEVRAHKVVIAAGTASAGLAGMVGERVPHQAVGGYHVMIKAPSISLSTPLLPMDFRFAITPMAGAIRLAGIYEFGGEGRSARNDLVARMLAHIDKVLPGIDLSQKTVWRGFRSYLPDGLPVISASARCDGLYYMFGFASSGMINAPASAKLLGELVRGETPSIDARPFSITRFAEKTGNQ